MRAPAALLLLGAALALGGCRKPDPAKEHGLVLGFFPNLTHAQALVGHSEGAFERALGDRPLTYKQFNAGPAAMEALVAGSVDASYVGSGPAIIAYLRSKGAVRIIAGSMANGAVLVVRGAATIEELKGKRIGTPQLGNTQDIALRHFLREKGIPFSDTPAPDRIAITPTSNADIFSLFKRGELAGAWVPEPWASRLVHEAGGKVLVDERTLWESGRFPTTVIVASKHALEHKRPQLLALLRAHLELTRRAQADPQAFAQRANEAFAELTGKRLTEAVVKEATSRLLFTSDPLPAELGIAAAHAQGLRFAPPGDVSGIVDDSLSRQLEAELPTGGSGG